MEVCKTNMHNYNAIQFGFIPLCLAYIFTSFSFSCLLYGYRQVNVKNNQLMLSDGQAIPGKNKQPDRGRCSNPKTSKH